MNLHIQRTGRSSIAWIPLILHFPEPFPSPSPSRTDSPFPSALQTSPVLRHTSLSAPPRFVVARTKLHELKFFKSFSFFLLPLLLEQHPGEKRFRDCAMAAMLAQRFYELFCNSPDRASSITPSPSPSGEGWWRWREVTGGRRRTTTDAWRRRATDNGCRPWTNDPQLWKATVKRIWTR